MILNNAGKGILVSSGKNCLVSGGKTELFLPVIIV